MQGRAKVVEQRPESGSGSLVPPHQTLQGGTFPHHPASSPADETLPPPQPTAILTSYRLAAGIADRHRVLALTHGVGAVPRLAALVLPVLRSAGGEGRLGGEVPRLPGRERNQEGLKSPCSASCPNASRSPSLALLSGSQTKPSWGETTICFQPAVPAQGLPGEAANGSLNRLHVARPSLGGRAQN